MRRIVVMVALMLVACSGKRLSVEERLLSSMNPFPDSVKLSLTPAGDPVYFDSANFHIRRIKFPSGKIHQEVYEDTISQIDRVREYYESGQLKESGMRTALRGINLGRWKYCSSTGQLDSIVNYDKYPVSYFDALRIAKKHGYEMPGLEVDFKEEGNDAYWEFVRQQQGESEDSTGSTVASVDWVIEIAATTGRVTKPKFIIAWIE